MKQINFPFVESVTSSRNLISVKIIDFSINNIEDSNYVWIYIEAKNYAGEILKFTTSVERCIAEYYQECYETRQPINIITEKINYLLFTPNISISE